MCKLKVGVEIGVDQSVYVGIGQGFLYMLFYIIFKNKRGIGVQLVVVVEGGYIRFVGKVFFGNGRQVVDFFEQVLILYVFKVFQFKYNVNFEVCGF